MKAQASSTVQPYWNADGDFSATSDSPYALQAEHTSTFYAPWGPNSWGVFGFGDFPNGTRGAADEYAFNASDGIGHAWVRQERRLVDARSGVVGFHQGLVDSAGSPMPTRVGILGRDAILAYRIMRENTSISSSLYSIDEAGILFDLILITDPYLVNGSVIRSFLVVDFYVHQECGPLHGGCAETNNTSVNHRVLRHTHYFSWRIHDNLREGEWVSDVVNLRWYLESSIQRAYCQEVTGRDDCSSQAPQAHLFALTVTAEAFGGSAGFAIDYEYLLQPNDCAMGTDSGNDFNHALRIENLNPGNLTARRMLQLDGWLGSGSLYRDSDDYYQFNVTPAFTQASLGLRVQTEESILIELYAPGRILKSVADGVQTTNLSYTYSSLDPLGHWYLRVHRSDGFGPYRLLFESLQISSGSTKPSPVSMQAKCTQVSPFPTTETPWPLIITLAVLAVLIVLGVRYLRRGRPVSP